MVPARDLEQLILGSALLLLWLTQSVAALEKTDKLWGCEEYTYSTIESMAVPDKRLEVGTPCLSTMDTSPVIKGITKSLYIPSPISESQNNCVNLPPGPQALILGICGFICVTLVHDRKFYIGLLAALLTFLSGNALANTHTQPENAHHKSLYMNLMGQQQKNSRHRAQFDIFRMEAQRLILALQHSSSETYSHFNHSKQGEPFVNAGKGPNPNQSISEDAPIGAFAWIAPCQILPHSFGPIWSDSTYNSRLKRLAFFRKVLARGPPLLP